MLRVCLDPGHGGRDRANRGPTGYVEADGVLDISLRARERLRELGFTVIMTREEDKTVSLAERAQLAKAQSADVFVSVHTDAASNPSAKGFTVFVSAHDPQSQALGNFVEQSFREIGRPSRGVRTRLLADGRDYYYVVREPVMPSILVECAFHTNPEEEALLKTPEFRQLLAEAISQGIYRYALATLQAVPVYLDGSRLPAVGRLIDSRTYLPVRVLAEALGLNVHWDATKREVRLSRE